MELFELLVKEDKLHPAFKLLLEPDNEDERKLLQSWSDGMPDRDGKFVIEFQTTFESSLWELYIHALIKELNYTVDFTYPSPDFSVLEPSKFIIEATVTRPEAGGKEPVGWSIQDIPSDFTAFNNEASLRLCNSIKQKLKKFRSSYVHLPHVKGLPFVLAIGAYDRPGSHLAAARPIIATLYGVYHDEQQTIDHDLDFVPAYEVTDATKKNGASVALGVFNNDACSEISAVIYSCLATWGKIRALANNPRYEFRFTSFHPSEDSINPVVFESLGTTYPEQLADGLYLFRNPYAKIPLPLGLFDHPRVAKSISLPENDFDFDCADDFLLARFVTTIRLPE